MQQKKILVQKKRRVVKWARLSVAAIRPDLRKKNREKDEKKYSIVKKENLLRFLWSRNCWTFSRRNCFAVLNRKRWEDEVRYRTPFRLTRGGLLICSCRCALSSCWQYKSTESVRRLFSSRGTTLRSSWLDRRDWLLVWTHLQREFNYKFKNIHFFRINLIKIIFQK